MGKLKALRPTLSSLPSRLTYATEPEKSERRSNPSGHSGHAWKKTYKWQKLRERILLRDLYTCRMCGAVHGDKSKLVADHITPHRNSAAMFWDQKNIQTLCADPCHNTIKQREEAQMLRGNWD